MEELLKKILAELVKLNVIMQENRARVRGLQEEARMRNWPPGKPMPPGMEEALRKREEARASRAKNIVPPISEGFPKKGGVSG